MIPMSRVEMVGSVIALLTLKRGDQRFGHCTFIIKGMKHIYILINNSCLGLFNVLTQQQCHWSCVHWVPCTLIEESIIILSGGRHSESQIMMGKRENSVNLTDMMNISSIL